MKVYNLAGHGQQTRLFEIIETRQHITLCYSTKNGQVQYGIFDQRRLHWVLEPHFHDLTNTQTVIFFLWLTKEQDRTKEKEYHETILHFN